MDKLLQIRTTGRTYAGHLSPRAPGAPRGRSASLGYLAAAAVLCLAASGACSGPGNYVWARDVSAGPSTNDYTIGVGDTVSVRVYEQEAMSVRARVRNDGKIALPLVGDVEAAGKRPGALAREVEGLLKQYVNLPRVTVNVEEFQPISVAVVGEVTRPGSFVVDPRGGVLQALANAGGTTDYADKDRIFVLRRFPKPTRIRFTYDELTHGAPEMVNFALQVGDVIVVE